MNNEHDEGPPRTTTNDINDHCAPSPAGSPNNAVLPSAAEEYRHHHIRKRTNGSSNGYVKNAASSSRANAAPSPARTALTEATTGSTPTRNPFFSSAGGESRSSRWTSTTSDLPLSIRLLKYLPYCPHCSEQRLETSHSSHPASRSSSAMRNPSSWHVGESWNPDEHACQPIGERDGEVDAATSMVPSLDYDLPALRRQNSAASPLVVAPMILAPPLSSSSQHQHLVERILAEYAACCRFYGCPTANAGILTTLRFSLPSLRVSGTFHDADMLALVELLLQYSNGPLRYIKRLDFSTTSRPGKWRNPQTSGFRSHGAFALSKLLQKTRHVAEVVVSGNQVGAYGASALFLACSKNPTVRTLLARRCRIGERGALAFCDVVMPSPDCGLNLVDLSANYIGFRGIVAVESAMMERIDRPDLPTLAVNVEGNLVCQEIMNSVTHGLGVLLAFLGSFLLSERVRDMSTRHRLSCMVYSASLVVLYVSSTLFHSFFTMLHTRYIFAVIDKCAIYILIAGSYTPFLQVALAHEPMYSNHLLAFIWVCCFLGIYVEAFLPGWKQKGRFSLAMYLGMGWSALVCLPEVARVVPESAMNLMILGGVGYTAGVPFFVRNNNLDHAVWHLFVLGGSIFHWCGIYFHVALLQ